MSYNIEDQEEYLKNESPYDMSDSKWAEMQQRIKTNVLKAAEQEASHTIKKFSYRKIAAIAASIFIIASISLFFIRSNHTTQSLPLLNNNMASNQTINAEQKLDNAISNLNETELNLSHQMSENEILEQNEYFEN